MTTPIDPSIFQKSDWRKVALDLVQTWLSEDRKPNWIEWNIWTQLVHEAAKQRAKSDWPGTDPCYEEAFDDGYAAGMAAAEDEDRENPAGPYPYA